MMPTCMNNSLASWCMIVYGMVTGAGGIPPLFAHAQAVYIRLSSGHTPKEPGNEAIYTLAAIQERWDGARMPNDCQM